MRRPLQVFLPGLPGCGKAEISRRAGRRLKHASVASRVMRSDDFSGPGKQFAAGSWRG